MQHFPAKHKDQNASSVMVCINSNTTNNLGGAAKVIVNPILSGWKLRWMNHVNLIFIFSRSIGLITNGI